MNNSKKKKTKQSKNNEVIKVNEKKREKIVYKHNLCKLHQLCLQDKLYAFRVFDAIEKFPVSLYYILI